MLFAAMLRLSGLSPEDAAAFFGVRRRVVIGWSQPGGEPPKEALTKLFKLIDDQEKEAERIIEAWEGAGRPARFEGWVAATDAEAQADGWPSVNAQAMAAAIAQATLIHVEMKLSPTATADAEATAPAGDA